jgi:hypothetical protein
MKVNNRKVRKFKGGGADMGDPGRAQERADRGYGSTSCRVDRSKVSAVAQGSNHRKSIASAKASTQQTTTPKTGFHRHPVTTGLNLAGSITGKRTWTRLSRFT